MSRSERFIKSRQRLKQGVNAENRRKERRVSLRESLSQALSRVEKAELIDLLLRLADDREELGLWLADQLDVEKEPQDEVFDVESDVARATHVPKHLINHNFPYDDLAYERIEAGLQRLVRGGHLQTAMALSTNLMRTGSYQVAMSEEGLTTDDIVRCLRHVLAAVETASMDNENKVEWYAQMEEAEEVEFIWDAVRGRT